jgi:hypothetical protein
MIKELKNQNNMSHTWVRYVIKHKNAKLRNIKLDIEDIYCIRTK